MKRILFVSNTSRTKRPYFDPSVRYRCFNLAENLTQQGNFVRVTSLFDFISLNDELLNFDIYVFHRPKLSGSFLKAFKRVKRQGSLLIADYDDLVFDVEHAFESSIYTSGRISKRDILRLFSENSAALQLFDNVTVSTQPLADRVAALNPSANVAVVHNYMSDSGRAYAEELNKSSSKPREYVGYFSGTRSHDKDIQVFSAAISEAAKAVNLPVLMVGEVTVPEDFYSGIELVKLPIMGYHDMYSELLRCKVVLAPLEQSIFNDCKSGLKYFESAIAGCQVAATPIPDIDRFNAAGLHKCRTPEDWYDAIVSAGSSTVSPDEVARVAVEQSSSVPVIKKWNEYVGELL